MIMTQNAVVKRLLPNGKAEVEVTRQSACGHDCAKCGGGCTEMVSGPILAEAVNAIGAQPNERVVIEGEFRQLMGLAAIVYAVPLVLFFGLFAVGSLFGLGEGGAAALGIVGFVLGVVGAIQYNKRYKERGTMVFTIVSRAAG
ncbi:polyunsaturated fatty acid synthase PfaA [Butyricicoccus sp. 1XD8-22]|nr:polyunsaturated fatty acid synthase PfaA [Butyricicoccus sp. 1XD8-22]